MSGHGFETLASATPYAGRSTVRIETVRTPEGGEVEREIVGHDDAVAVVAVTADGEVVLLRQYRQAVRGYVLEIPAGTLDVEGEEPREAAARELAEETGYHASDLEHLVTFDNSAGWTDERTHVYLATDVRLDGTPDGFEAEHEEADMSLVHLDLAEAIGLARRGELPDAKTLIGLLLTEGRG
jgi:8-oxo-dGDP phosphatase